VIFARTCRQGCQRHRGLAYHPRLRCRRSPGGRAPEGLPPTSPDPRRLRGQLV